MKELTIEEKAQRYDEAIERAKKWYNAPNIDKMPTYGSRIIEEIFPEFKECEGEKIRKELLQIAKESEDSFYMVMTPNKRKTLIAWLEKQCEHANFRNKIQIGDKVTRNEDGELVNLSQLNRVAKKDEKQGRKETLFVTNVEKNNHPIIVRKIGFGRCAVEHEQKPALNIGPKFKKGEWLVENHPNNYARFLQILEIYNFNGKNNYAVSRDLHNDEDVAECEFIETHWHLFNIKDAKAGDILCGYTRAVHPWIGIFHKLNTEDTFNSYCFLQAGQHGKFCPPSEENIFGNRNVDSHASEGVVPATKEQRDTIMKAMADAGYTFDFEKKELKKIEQSPAWSEEDDKKAERIIRLLQEAYDINCINGSIDWLVSLKDRYTWKPSDEQMNTLEYYMHTLVCNEHKEILFGLYSCLKKLREE